MGHLEVSLAKPYNRCDFGTMCDSTRSLTIKNRSWKLFVKFKLGSMNEGEKNSVPFSKDKIHICA